MNCREGGIGVAEVNRGTYSLPGTAQTEQQRKVFSLWGHSHVMSSYVEAPRGGI